MSTRAVRSPVWRASRGFKERCWRSAPIPMKRPLCQSLTSLTRRLVSCAGVLAICFSILPIPILQRPSASLSTQKDTSQPFPCQNRSCGCCSAAQCWKKCCCFTNRQKLQWAKDNHVAVPPEVAVAAEQESASEKVSHKCELCAGSAISGSTSPRSTFIGGLRDHTLVRHASEVAASVLSEFLNWHREQLRLGALCEPIRKLSDVHKMLAEGLTTVFPGVSDAPSPGEPLNPADPHDSSAAASSPRFVLVLKAMECHGQLMQWCLCAPVTLPARVQVQLSNEVRLSLPVPASDRLRGASRQPPVPPPQIA